LEDVECCGDKICLFGSVAQSYPHTAATILTDSERIELG